MHENEIIVCPQPIFFDARDLVYQMKEPRSKSIQKQSLFGRAWTVLEFRSNCAWQPQLQLLKYEKMAIS